MKHSTQAGKDAYGALDDGCVVDLQLRKDPLSKDDDTFAKEASQMDVHTVQPLCPKTDILPHDAVALLNDDHPAMEDPAKLLSRVRDLEQKLERTARELLEAQQHKSLEEVTNLAGLVRSPVINGEGSPAPPTKTPKSQWNNEIKRWKRVTSRHGSTEIYKASEKVEDVRARSSGYVLTVYDEYDHEGNRTHVSLEINSAPLLDLLRKVITYYPGDEFDTLRGLE